MHKEIVKSIRKNMKLEALIIIGTIFCAIFNIKRFIPEYICYNLSKYFSSGRIKDLSNFFSITIGIYLAIVTLLATSTIGISKEILERKTDRQLIIVLCFGMIENIAVVFLSIFADSNLIHYYNLFLCSLVIVALISFVKFIILIILIFIANMERMAKTIDEDNEYKENIQSLLEVIARNTKNTKNFKN